jgi:hypothetical protein
MRDSSKAQQELLSRYKEEFEALATKWNEDAKETAERILNAALVAGKGQIQAIMDESALSAATAVSKGIDAALERALAENCKASSLSKLNFLTAVVTFLAAIIVFWVAAR